MRGEALAAVINNHAELMELWDWLLTVSKDTELKARIRGVKRMMTTFDYPGRAASEADRQPRARLARFIHLSCLRQQTYPGSGKNLTQRSD